MKFIKKIILNNFQSHKNSSLEFNPNLNIIVGPSDSGKSSIIRAIKWVLFNEPSGDFFIREGETECSVELYFSDGSIVTRHRSTSKNSYTINYSNGEELILTGFGVKVPEEVIDITGIKKVPFDQNNLEIINISDQLEGPFLLSEKNSTKAFVIGGLAGVDIVDDSIRDLLRELRGLNIRKNTLDEEIGLLDEDLKEFKELDHIKQSYQNINRKYEEIKSKKDLLEKLEYYKQKLNGINIEKKTCISSLNKLNQLDQVNKNYLSLYQNIDLFNKYKTLEKKCKYIDKSLKETNNIIKNYKNVDLIKINYKILDEKISSYKIHLDIYSKEEKIAKEIKKLKLYLNNFKEYKKVNNIYTDLIRLNSNYDKISNYFKSYNDINKRLYIGNNYIKNFNNLNKLDDSVDLLNRGLKRYNLLNNINIKYKQIYKEKNIVIKKVNSANKDINYYSEEYSKILLKNKICPTCFSRIDESKIENIVNNLNK